MNHIAYDNFIFQQVQKVQRRFTKMINNMDGKSYRKIILFEAKDT